MKRASFLRLRANRNTHCFKLDLLNFSDEMNSFRRWQTLNYPKISHTPTNYP